MSELTWQPEDDQRARERARAFCLSRRSWDSHERGGSGCDCDDLVAIVCAAVLGERRRCAAIADRMPAVASNDVAAVLAGIATAIRGGKGEGA